MGSISGYKRLDAITIVMTRTKIKDEGFTLVELMVVITLIALMLLMGQATFKTRKWVNKLNSESKEFYYDLIFAKMTALENQNYISICFNRNMKINNDSNSTPIDYIIIKSDDCNLTSITNPDDIIKIKQAEKGSVRVNKIISSPRVTFDPNGFVDGITNLTISLTTSPPNNTKIAQDVTINRFGRIRVGNTYETN